MVRGLALTLALLAGVPAAAQCRLALALGMDISASVDAREYALMMQGTAAALRSDAVRAALFSELPVALAAYVWAGRREQAVAVHWRLIDNEAALEEFATALARYPRPRGDPVSGWAGMTAVGAAMLAGQSLLSRAPECDAQVLDIAGDGVNNDGPEPGPLRARMGPITVNALAVAGAVGPGHVDYVPGGPPLAEWMRLNVIHGPGAFVEPADSYDDFERAMQRKLERELSPPLLGYMACCQPPRPPF